MSDRDLRASADTAATDAHHVVNILARDDLDPTMPPAEITCRPTTYL